MRGLSCARTRLSPSTRILAVESSSPHSWDRTQGPRGRYSSPFSLYDCRLHTWVELRCLLWNQTPNLPAEPLLLPDPPLTPPLSALSLWQWTSTLPCMVGLQRTPFLTYWHCSLRLAKARVITFQFLLKDTVNCLSFFYLGCVKQS